MPPPPEAPRVCARACLCLCVRVPHALGGRQTWCRRADMVPSRPAYNSECTTDERACGLRGVRGPHVDLMGMLDNVCVYSQGMAETGRDVRSRQVLLFLDPCLPRVHTLAVGQAGVLSLSSARSLLCCRSAADCSALLAARSALLHSVVEIAHL